MSKIVTASIQIRHAQDSEREALADLTKLSYREFASAYNFGYWDQYEASTRATLLGENSVERIVAESEGKIIGSVLLCPPYEREVNGKALKNPYPEFRLLAVLPEYRNLKVGASLISFCEQITASRGSQVITLHTTPAMKTAKAMYERRQYQRFEQIDFEPVSGFKVLGYAKKLFNQNSKEVNSEV
jgi:ribosomal protein S18 acetylase RimI-like enzyme